MSISGTILRAYLYALCGGTLDIWADVNQSVISMLRVRCISWIPSMQGRWPEVHCYRKSRNIVMDPTVFTMVILRYGTNTYSVFFDLVDANPWVWQHLGWTTLTCWCGKLFNVHLITGQTKQLISYFQFLLNSLSKGKNLVPLTPGTIAHLLKNYWRDLSILCLIKTQASARLQVSFLSKIRTKNYNLWQEILKVNQQFTTKGYS
jgi:hypothetical protein